METKQVIRIAAAVIAALFIGFLFWFWSLGAVASEEIQRVRAEAIEGSVEWRSGSGEWQELSGARELDRGDGVRTGETGQARVLWGDRGVTRIDPGTEILIESSENGDALFSALLKFRVESGRVWNRVLKVLDVDGGMQVETSDVVATVRGTAFGVEKAAASTDIAVTESVVGVPFALIREGQWGSFNASGTLDLRQLTDADEWAIENREKDREFDADLLRVLNIRFEDRSGRSAPVWMTRLSERLHLSVLGGEKKKDLAEKYALRHLAAAALNERTRDAHLDALKARSVAADDHAARLLHEVHALSILLASDRHGRREEAGDFVNRLRDLRTEIASRNKETSLFASALSIDDRIDDYLFGPTTGESRSKGGRELLLGLADLAETLERDGELDIPLREALRKKAEAMGYRLGFDDFTLGGDHTFGDAASIAEEEESRASATGTDEGETENEASAAPTSFTAYQFYATPIKARVGEPVRLSVYGVTKDGFAQNITSEADFSIAPPAAGELQENYYFPAEPGAVTLRANVNRDGETKTLSTTIEVEGAAAAETSIRDVRFEFQGPTSLPCSSSVPFKVIAHYADGSTKDVTLTAKKSVSNPNLIHIQDDRVLTYCPAEDTASAEAYATYEEGGNRFTAVGVITVTRESEPTRGNPNSIPSITAPPTTIF